VPCPFVSVLHSKYQIQADAPIMNWTQPMIKELTQNSAKI